MTTEPKPTPWYRPPVMWIVIGLLFASVVGGVTLVVLSIVEPDREVYSERLDPAPADEP